MGITVKGLDVYKAKELLKSCPKEVQQYVKCIEEQVDNQRNQIIEAIYKIKELSKNE